MGVCEGIRGEGQLLAAEVAAAGFRLRKSWDRTGGDWVGVRDPQ